jgi:hypothetical protein
MSFSADKAVGIDSEAEVAMWLAKFESQAGIARIAETLANSQK